MATFAAIMTAHAIGHPDPYQVDQVLQETWSHLAPKARVLYQGHILIAKSTFSGEGVVVLDYTFTDPEGQELESSPWFYHDICDFAHNQVAHRRDAGGWGVWRWEGSFERLKNGKSRWRGKTRPQRLVDRFQRKAA